MHGRNHQKQVLPEMKKDTFLRRIFRGNVSYGSMSEISDVEIIKRIVFAHEKDLYSLLVDRYGKVVYRLCSGFAISPADAEDLAQEAFIKIYLNLHRFRGEAKFSTWVYRLTLNMCLNVERKAATADMLPLSVLGDGKSTAESPEKAVEKKERYWPPASSQEEH